LQGFLLPGALVVGLFRAGSKAAAVCLESLGAILTFSGKKAMGEHASMEIFTEL